MSKIQVEGGTPVGSAALCRTCSHAHILSGYRESEMMVVCTDTYPNFAVPFTVRECTAYNDKAKPDWDEMKRLAIHVSPPIRSAKKIGFGARPMVHSEAEEEDSEEEENDEADD